MINSDTFYIYFNKNIFKGKIFFFIFFLIFDIIDIPSYSYQSVFYKIVKLLKSRFLKFIVKYSLSS